MWRVSSAGAVDHIEWNGKTPAQVWHGPVQRFLAMDEPVSGCLMQSLTRPNDALDAWFREGVPRLSSRRRVTYGLLTGEVTVSHLLSSAACLSRTERAVCRRTNSLPVRGDRNMVGVCPGHDGEGEQYAAEYANDPRQQPR
jgi:hypothetical protein